MGELNTIRLIKSMVKHGVDADGLTPLDRYRIKRDFSRRIRQPHLRRTLHIFSDLVVTPLEREELKSRLWLTPRALRYLDRLIGKDGRGLLRRREAFLARKAELAPHIVRIATQLIRRPRYFKKIPAHLRRTVVASAVRIARKQNVDISLLIASLPRAFIEDRKLMLPLLRERPRYLSVVAPQLVRFPIPLAIAAYHIGITFGNRFPHAKALASVVDNHILAANDIHDPRPLAVVIFPKNDWNSIFSASSENLSLLTKGYRVRYYEVATDAEAAEALRQATARRKASLVVFGGHGDTISLSLGAGDPEMTKRMAMRYYIDTGDGHLFKGLGKRVVDGGHVVLQSCSNGHGGPSARNLLNVMSRLFPQAYVHAQAESGDIRLLLDRNGRFIGTTQGNNQRVDHVVVRRSTGYSATYEAPYALKRFPHPAVRTTATVEGRRRMLRKLASRHDELVRRAAKHELGQASWGNRLLPFSQIVIWNLISSNNATNTLKHYFKLHLLKPVDILMKIGRPAVPTLIAALRTGSVGVRGVAIRGLVKLLGKDAVPWLISTFDDVSSEFRHDIVNWVGKLGSRGEIPWLKTLLSHKDVELKRRALAALVNLDGVRHLSSIYALERRTPPEQSAIWWIRNPHALPQLLVALRDKRVFMRQGAAHALGFMRDKRSIPALIAAASDADRVVRGEALTALTRMGDPRADIALGKALGEVILFFGDVVLDYLKRIKRRAVPALIVATGNRSWVGRMHAVEMLRSLRDKRAVPALVARVKKDPNHDVRRAAVDALSEFGGSQAEAALVAAAGDKQPLIRIRAAVALIKRGRRNYMTVIDALSKATSWRMRFAIARALSEIGDPRGDSLMARVLKAAKDYHLHEAMTVLNGSRDGRLMASFRKAAPALNSMTKYLIAMALARSKDRAAIPLLLAELSSSKAGARAAAAEALVKIWGKPYVTKIVPMLADPSAYVRQELTRVLGNLRERRAVPQLVKMLNGDTTEIRIAAAKALGTIGDRRAIPALIMAMRDWRRNMWISLAAVDALGKFKSAAAKKALHQEGF